MRTLFHKLKQIIKTVKLPLVLDFIRWLLIDIFRRIRDGKDLSVFGVYLFCGIHGKGKTISMVYEIEKDLDRNPQLKVYTNFYYEHQDGHLGHWSEMIPIAEAGNAIIAIDEVHTSFNSRSWKDFPEELITLISQNRKDGVKLLMSAQTSDSVEKTIRDQSHYVVNCKNIGKRLFLNVYYRIDEYNKSPEKRRAAYRNYFVASDELRAAYNTKEKIRSLKVYQKSDVPKTTTYVTNNVVAAVDPAAKKRK
ncbi:zonular occludens toxin domain-containing protein [Paenibacillus harenae]|uniref:Zona occludens toxin N-terminal domain-containing protein n=1 Tax=Paenibacillus harenae TaxID=306543 RepID=A0ABT9UF32_PAEHA|nr:zonular occludens toxin domain-containing protein [Paenibacillus harenae]MDQ0116829.1 hypothetical protein [Paenibacillus harenae]